MRWSLVGLPDSVLEELRDYVEDASYARFSQLESLRFKTWRARAGEWFEGNYVFDDDALRAEFQATFEAAAATSPVSFIVGRTPEMIEPCEVVAVAEGGAGFKPAARLDSAQA